MTKIEIEYHSGKKEIFESPEYNADKLMKELETAWAHKKSFMEIEGFSIFPNLVKKVRDI